MGKSIEERIFDLWELPEGMRYAYVAIFIPKWPGKPYHQYGMRDKYGEHLIKTPRDKTTELEFENGATRYYNDLTLPSHLRILKIEKIIEEADFAECLTSPYSYVREYKQWLVRNK